LPLTQIKLYKILYFAHGWYLASKSRPLIAQDFEAWEYGPVVRVLYNSFKEFKKSPIMNRARKLNIYENVYEDISPLSNETDKLYLSNVFHEYKHFDAWVLSDMTHTTGSPWDIVWNAKDGIGRIGLRLRNDEIRTHFLAFSKECGVM
jgi:uncharacterized phage-associated protein